MDILYINGTISCNHEKQRHESENDNGNGGVNENQSMKAAWHQKRRKSIGENQWRKSISGIDDMKIVAGINGNGGNIISNHHGAAAASTKRMA